MAWSELRSASRLKKGGMVYQLDLKGRTPAHPLIARRLLNSWLWDVTIVRNVKLGSTNRYCVQLKETVDPPAESVLIRWLQQQEVD